MSLGLPADSPLAADIVFRYLQRLCQALAERLERFQSSLERRIRVAKAAIAAAETEPRPGLDRVFVRMRRGCSRQRSQNPWHRAAAERWPAARGRG